MKLGVLVGFSAVAASAAAAFTVTTYPEDICATEAIYPNGIRPYEEGITSTGVRYKIVQNNGQESYSESYTSFKPGQDAVRIEFDQPMAAVGANIMLSGYGSFQTAPDSEPTTPSLFVTDSGYRGVVANGAGIREITFTTDSGPMSIDRIDLRPMPIATADTFSVYENSSRSYSAGIILNNDLHADGTVLVSPPLHAARFEMHDDGSFVYQPAKNYEGEDSFLYRATNGFGASASAPAMVTINVLAANCPPEFAKGPDVSCLEDSDLQTIQGWASGISAGPDREADQTLAWEITTDNDHLFAVLPTIDANGDLSYQPAPFESGMATVTVQLKDNGGTENGGIDSSAPETFTITVEPKEHAPVLEPIFDCAVREGDALVLNARSTEWDAGVPVVYSLDQAPDGASIDQVSGQIVWRPKESDAGQMPTFVVRATEMGDRQLSTTTTFRAEVLEQAKPPQVDPIPDMQAEPGHPVSTKILAKTSGDIRYFLASPVSGAQLNPLTGQFLWMPSAGQAGQTFSFAVSVVDPDAPTLCTVETFTVHVGESTLAKAPSRQLIAKAGQTSGEAAMIFSPSRKGHPKR